MKYHFRKYIPLLLGPLCFLCLVYLPIISLDEKIVKVIGITSWMLIWWISEEIAVKSAGNLQPVPWIEPEDVADAVVYLVSAKARFITGSQFVIDAGLLTR